MRETFLGRYTSEEENQSEISSEQTSVCENFSTAIRKSKNRFLSNYCNNYKITKSQSILFLTLKFNKIKIKLKMVRANEKRKEMEWRGASNYQRSDTPTMFILSSLPHHLFSYNHLLRASSVAARFIRRSLGHAGILGFVRGINFLCELSKGARCGCFRGS